MRVPLGVAGDAGPDPADVIAQREECSSIAHADSSHALSPSRASDFMSCPLLYRFRVIDNLPEKPSPGAVRGPVVHSVLERLFDLPATDRTPDRAQTMLEPAWDDLLAAEPERAARFSAEGGGGG